MNFFWQRQRTPLLFETALGVFVLLTPVSFAEEIELSAAEVGLLSSPPSKGGKPLQTFTQTDEPHNTPSFSETNQDVYTINFSNISIIEYIKFVSRITGLNFIFNEADLEFNVTIVSEDPVTIPNIMATLVQVLRVHNLSVLEQEGNLLITAAKNVSQAATIVSSDIAADSAVASPVVTRVFRIKNANLNTVATVVKPLLSDAAILETSIETHQLIVTDITANVDKISTLLASIDTPHTSLEIESYNAENVEPKELIELAMQLLAPFIEGNPLVLVPQNGTHTIFIVATPYLIERALTILEDLDNASITEAVPANSNIVYLYKIQHQDGSNLMLSIQKVAEELQTNNAKLPLVNTLKKAQLIKDSNSILFMGDQASLDKVKELMPMLDSVREKATVQKSELYIYKLRSISIHQLQSAVGMLISNLKSASQPDDTLIAALQSMSYLQDKNAVVFTGHPTSIQQISGIMAALDTPADEKEQVFLYKPKFVSRAQLQQAFTNLASNLDNMAPTDLVLKKTLLSAKWIEDSQSFLFRADAATLPELKELLQDLDSAEGIASSGANTFVLYKLKYAPCDAVVANLTNIAENLDKSGVPNQALIATINNIKCLKQNNSLLLTGSASAIEQARKLIAEFDQPGSVQSEPSKSSFFIYKPRYQPAQTIQLSLVNLGKDLEASGLIDPDLLSTISSIRYTEANKALIFTGSPTALDKVKELLLGIDILSPEQAQIQKLGETTFLIYKIQYVPAGQLVGSLRSLVIDLQKTGAIDISVVEAINGMKWIKDTNSILFVGSPNTLQQVELMLKKFDIPALAMKPSVPLAPPGSFIVYNPKYVPGDELISILEDFKQNLLASGINDHNLYDSIDNLRWIPKTCSLLVSGNQESIAKIEDLLRRFDIPNKQEAPPSPSIQDFDNTSFLVYKLQYHQGNEITSALKQITGDIAKGGSTQNQNLLYAINSLQWIRVTNSLLASGDAETLTKLKNLIENLDVPLRQIFIEVLVIETSVTNTQNFGLQWGGRMQYLNRFGAATGNFPLSNANSSSATTNSTSIGSGIGSGIVNSTVADATTGSVTEPLTANIPFLTGFDLGVIGDIIMHKGKSFISLGSLVNALQTDTDSTIVMNPKIITQDNRNSTIFVGNNIPFIGSFVVSQQNFVSQSQNIEYRDIGFNLSITPTIGTNDVVTLDITNDISEVVSTPIIGSTGSQNNNQTITGIQTSHTSMTTRVHVPNQHFVVLSGMLQDSKARFKTQIPCLGGLPIIGAAFSESDRINSKQNVIMFVRPHIINSADDYKAVTDQQDDLYRKEATLPVLQEEYDAGIDWVKTPENE